MHETKTFPNHGGAELRPAVRRVETEPSEVTTDPVEGVGPTLPPEAVVVLDEVVEYFESAATAMAERPSPEFVRSHFFDFEYLERFHEVERYWVNEPYAYVSILFDEENREYRYHVVEPTLDLFEQYVRADLVTLLRNSLMYLEVDPGEDREAVFFERVQELIDRHAATVDEGTLHKVLYYLERDFLNYGPIDAIMRDRNIEDISCDGEEVPVFVYHREYRDLKTNVVFGGQRLNSFTVQLAQRAGQSISVSDPLLDASLPDGSRLQLTLGGDVSTRGSNFTIRKFADIPFTPVDLVEWNTFSVDQMAYFWLAIENNKSLIFAGGTGSGKTTSMNAVSFFVPPSSKVVSIEDTREIDLPHENWVQSVTRESATADGRGEVSMYNLLQAALRQRPEYLIVGEIRTEPRVALTFFQAMGTGHTAYTTLHADSVETALSRLQNPPLSVPTQMLQDLDIVNIQKQTFIGERRVRRNAVVAELGVDEHDIDRIRHDEVFRWDAASDTHERVGESRVLAEIATERGWDDAELERQLEARRTVLEFLIQNDVTDYETVGATVHLFARDPDSVLAAIDDGRLAADETDLLGTTTDDADATPDAGVEVPDPSEFETWEAVVAAAEADHDAAGETDADTPDDQRAEADGGDPADDEAFSFGASEGADDHDDGGEGR
ncbi:type II/IV secretion system ATPase subunit [Salinirubellus salinus]|uniref:Type II/IV secretion system ATPase subunit n=1 Tax=Salinirubellus salinus TaxID=1364945 RepID=A0A9E7R6I2_9EURY|nr:type II/IV secretion system ATPase subunit [Salinirubellus salinus]UWM56467.1 type II/IV secretion system ATPase subunit [Salinirubellus salinus]